MKRDLALCRDILLRMEECPHGFADPKVIIEQLEAGGWSADQVGYHAYLLHDAGLIVGIDVTCRGCTGPMYLPRKMTSAGHEFIDALRSETVWKEISGKVTTIGGWTFQAVISAAAAHVTRLLMPG